MKKDASQQKADRLAEALRANLRRRKVPKAAQENSNRGASGQADESAP